MDFDLSADQLDLQAGARQLLGDWAASRRVRTHIDTGDPYDSELWAAMVEQGWCAIAVPESQGGLGLGWVEVAVLLAEVGRHTAAVPLLPTLMTIAALVDDPNQAELVERLSGAGAIGAVAWTSDDSAIVVSGDGGSVTLTGRLGPVDAVSVADVVVVVVPDGVYLVDLNAIGHPVRQPAMDLTRALSWLDLDATPATRIGDRAASQRLGALGAVAASAELLGGAERCLELAVDYAKDRVQFGQPIGSFQAVKHRCADMLVDVEGMRSVTWYGAWCVEAADDGWAMAASTAKVWSADASKRVLSSALQVHGGIGFTWEHDLHLFIKRGQFGQRDFGDASWHRSLLARALRAQVAAGASVM